MKLDVDGLPVIFPYDSVYPEQLEYMRELKRSLDAKGHALLEMPTGTGKTVTLLSLVTSYQAEHPEVGKLVYCTRTVGEMEKVMEELGRVSKARKDSSLPGPPITGVCLTSRRNLCIHPQVSKNHERNSVDAKCRSLTAPWVREKAVIEQDIETCAYYEGFDREGVEVTLPEGVYSLDDLKSFGREKGWCPYFLARHAILSSSVIVFNYQYLLDPRISQLVTKSLQKDSVVVFDEAHNIDNVCIESLSVDLSKRVVDAAAGNIAELRRRVQSVKETDMRRLEDEYKALVEGVQLATGQTAADTSLAPPLIASEALEEAIPGNIRKAEHFLSFLRRIVDFMKVLLRQEEDWSESPKAFLHTLTAETVTDKRALKHVYSRLNSLFRTLEVESTDAFTPISFVADLCTLLAAHSSGFVVLFEAKDPQSLQPTLKLVCLDASIAMAPVFERFDWVVITSGTLSPLDLYPKLLRFEPKVSASFKMTLPRNSVLPLIVTHGDDQAPLTSSFQSRGDRAVVRNYASLFEGLCASVPDGVVAFFPSYVFLEEVVVAWKEMGVLARASKSKLLFMETTDIQETALALDHFKRACDSGRGAVFLSVARGKVAEGIDFDRHYGRAVVLFGVPYQNVRSRPLIERLTFLRDTFGLSEAEFLAFDALRQSAQCVGRVMRSKQDYALMIFGDRRYAQADKKSKLPAWLQQFLGKSEVNLSIESALLKAKEFLFSMSREMPSITNPFLHAKKRKIENEVNQ